MQIALYQPDIPQNVGSVLRLCACMDAVCHIIEPCGFILDDKRLKRVAMDYAAQAEVIRHASWQRFLEAAHAQGSRVVLLSTKASTPYYQFHFAPTDILLVGRESAGVPQEVAEVADAVLRIPMAPEARSLNMAMAAAIVLAEAVRQFQVVDI